MDLIGNLAIGFGTALTPENLFFCFLGAVLGTVIGVLPGVGPLVTISMLLPFTYTLGPATAMIMLAGIFYGAQYGGSTTAILMRIPGEVSSVVTTLDGYKMAQQGRAGVALAVAAIGSFIAGTIATLAIALIGPTLGQVALSFGPPEYFSLMVLGLAGCLLFSSKSLLDGVAAIFIGLALAMVGIDATTGDMRYVFDVPELMEGISFVAIAVGLFGLLEVAKNLTEPEEKSMVTEKIGKMVLSRKDWKESLPAILRGTGLGSLLGLLPGGGLITAPFASYLLEKKLSKKPLEFGEGAIPGVAGPEAANNAAAQTSFVPLLFLGIPANAIMALMLSALMVQGVTPGPTTALQNPTLFWGVIASMWIGNAMLLVLNLPLVGLWAKLAQLSYRWLLPIILVCCAIGVYSGSNAPFEVYLSVVFAILGVYLWKLNCDPTPVIMAFVLAIPLETNLRSSLSMSHGSATIFATRPICAALLAVSALILFVPVAKRLWMNRILRNSEGVA